MRTHFGSKGGTALCGRGKRVSENVRRVDCLLCQAIPLFARAKTTDALARKEAFDAQVPRQLSEPWHQGNVPMVCRVDGGTLFRMGERTCMGHYQNYVCASCGHAESRLTETGMSF